MTVMRLKGFDGIDKRLRQMQDNVRTDVLKRVAEKSADAMEQDYRQGAPPVIAKSVRTRVVDASRYRATAATGTKHPLAHIFEFGTKQRQTGQGWRRGRIRKIGFARRAFDTNITKWFVDTGKLLWKEVSRA